MRHDSPDSIDSGLNTKRSFKSSELENELIDDIMTSSMFPQNKISLKGIDNFINTNRTNFNINGVPFHEYCKQ